MPKLLYVALVFLASLANANTNKYFKGIHGAFVLLDERTEAMITINHDIAELQVAPCDIFSIPLSILALNEKWVTDINQVVKYRHQFQGKNLKSHSLETKDHSLASALDNNVEWVFKKIVQSTNPKILQEYLQKFSFGNQKLALYPSPFWQDGTLTINAIEITKFLKKLFNNELPVRNNLVNQVKVTLIEEEADQYILRTKTGFCAPKKNQTIAWMVGNLEEKSRVSYFATMIQGSQENQLRSKIRNTTMRILKDLNLKK